jgi:hypothetical protein
VVFFNGFIVLSSLEPVLLIFSIIKRQYPWKSVGLDDIQSSVINCDCETVLHVLQLIFDLRLSQNVFHNLWKQAAKKKKKEIKLLMEIIGQYLFLIFATFLSLSNMATSLIS